MAKSVRFAALLALQGLFMLTQAAPQPAPDPSPIPGFFAHLTSEWANMTSAIDEAATRAENAATSLSTSFAPGCSAAFMKGEELCNCGAYYQLTTETSDGSTVAACQTAGAKEKREPNTAEATATRTPECEACL
ncbi:MAG: hypothetical protein M1820_005038 [Bogoriella megaspora]|nr:MAG: hypothetical protein M1820_005038 [Bogoriella megaspora]